MAIDSYAQEVFNGLNKNGANLLNVGCRLNKFA